jgi:hypothetical protein
MGTRDLVFPVDLFEITYLENSLPKTVHVNACDLPWSRNVEIESGDCVSLSAQADIFTSVSCSIDSLGLLNPIKGRKMSTGTAGLELSSPTR